MARDFKLRLRDRVDIEIDLRFDPHDPPYEPGITDQCRALAVLKAGADVLDGLSVPYNLADGTVLGWLRGGGFIEGDTDIDLQVDLENYRPELKLNLLEAGFVLLREEHIEGDLQHQQFMRDRIKLDIAYYRKRGRSFRILCPFRQAFLVYRLEPFEVKSVDFMGYEMPVPADPVAYVVECYGEDWRVPVTEWHWAFCVSTLKAAVGTAGALKAIAGEWIDWQQKYNGRTKPSVTAR